MKTTQQQARAFFYQYAGWSQAQGETEQQGRTRCARVLARAEAQGRNAGLSFDWDIDPDGDSSEFDRSEPPWQLWYCLCRNADGQVVASLSGIDFGRDGKPWGSTYRRVVEAELASEAQPARAAATPESDGDM